MKINTQQSMINTQLDDVCQGEQENIIKALTNGGAVTDIIDAKGVKYTNVPDFRKVTTNTFVIDKESILDVQIPPNVPIIDEEVFANKSYLFDAIRIEEDGYILATKGYDSLQNNTFVILSLEQLILTQDYYLAKAKAKANIKAQEKTKRQEQYWDNLSEEQLERFFNKKGLFHSLPVKIQKTITEEEYEALTWQEKEKIYKFYKRYRSKHLRSLSENTMWTSFHHMYEQFINPSATMPRPRTSNPEVFKYWRKFREMIGFMTKDIKIQRQNYYEAYIKGVETSFGESNTNISLKEKHGILVKRQDGKVITPIDIMQIESAWIKMNQAFGNLKHIADKHNLKISHCANTKIFASRAIGAFVPSMQTIGVSNKSGNMQFESIFAHEIGHFIDYLAGQAKGKHFASFNYEDTAGIIAFTFRDLMNKPKKQQTDYINATQECFARAIQQYYGWKLYGDEAIIVRSDENSQRNIPIYFADEYVNKHDFETQIVPLIEQFLTENMGLLML